MDEKTYQHLLGRVRKRNMTLRNGESADPTNEPEIPPPTPAEMTAMAASELKHSISTCVYNIDSLLVARFTSSSRMRRASQRTDPACADRNWYRFLVCPRGRFFGVLL